MFKELETESRNKVTVYWQKRIIRESLEIILMSPLINREDGAHLSAAWFPLHSKLRGDAKRVF